jgi:hypothetical protein
MVAPGFAFIACASRSSHWSGASRTRPLLRLACPLLRLAAFSGFGASGGPCGAPATLAAKLAISGNDPANDHRRRQRGRFAGAETVESGNGFDMGVSPGSIYR